ncbi:MAG: hypothetical protein DI589_22950 [Shinella sp.]|nr:MAG: hypothetical protein DI589_22950 [Shinella sp.]
MTADLTISEKVVCRLLEAAWSHYLTLPPERQGEAFEFRRKLDEVAAVVKMRPAHRAAQEAEEALQLKVIAGGARPRKQKGPAEAATSPSHGSTKPKQRISA